MSEELEVLKDIRRILRKILKLQIMPYKDKPSTFEGVPVEE